MRLQKEEEKLLRQFIAASNRITEAYIKMGTPAQEYNEKFVVDVKEIGLKLLNKVFPQLKGKTKFRQMDLEEAIKNEKDGVPHISNKGSKDKEG